MFSRKLAAFIPACLAVCLLFAACTAGPLPAEPANNLVVTPAPATMDADKMTDDELLLMFRQTLYPNAVFAWNLMNHTGLETNDDIVLPDKPAATHYVAVTNIPTMVDLKANYEAIFSRALCENSVYPLFLQSEAPLFLEENGQLYFNDQTGGGVGLAPQYGEATVLSKTPDAFFIEVPMVTPDGEGEPYTFTAVKQSGYWVLDSFFLF